MVAGRPRTVSLPPDEMIALGKEMIEWIKINKPLHISKFYSINKGFLFSEWETMIKKPEFVKYYEQGMYIIGEQYLDKNSNVREGASQRWQRVYFKDLARMEDSIVEHKINKDFESRKKLMDHEAFLKQKIGEVISEESKELLKALIDQVSFKSDLSHAESTSNKDMKSI